jgi:hypothetical protein
VLNQAISDVVLEVHTVLIIHLQLGLSILLYNKIEEPQKPTNLGNYRPFCQLERARNNSSTPHCCRQSGSLPAL